MAELLEHSVSKPGIGTIRVLGSAGGDELKMSEIDFGEFETEAGKIYGPLTPKQIHGIMTLATEEWQAVAICESAR